MMFSSSVSRGAPQQPLVAYLAGRFTYLSQDEWRARILERRVLVNRMPSTPDALVKAGDLVSYNLPEFTEPEADTRYRIVYEDGWLVAVDKPGNLLVHKAGISITKNLVFLLRHSSGNPSYAKLDAVSRIDRETSGLVLFAKDRASLTSLHRSFAKKSVEKEYIAVVHNAPETQSMTIEMPIGLDAKSAIHYKFSVDEANGKPATTRIEVISVEGSHSLIRAMPRTGRTHQIRVHCAAMGFPIVGDKLYGMRESDYLEWRNDPASHSHMLEFPRQALHCKRLSFTHPATGEPLSIEAPIPDDMLGLITSTRLGL
jgi:RluA family pseudouridine synthase